MWARTCKSWVSEEEKVDAAAVIFPAHRHHHHHRRHRHNSHLSHQEQCVCGNKKTLALIMCKDPLEEMVLSKRHSAMSQLLFLTDKGIIYVVLICILKMVTYLTFPIAQYVSQMLVIWTLTHKKKYITWTSLATSSLCLKVTPSTHARQKPLDNNDLNW